jgi:hypothetical protein
MILISLNVCSITSLKCTDGYGLNCLAKTPHVFIMEKYGLKWGYKSLKKSLVKNANI